MGEIADNFGGKVDGELIRAADWNGLIGAIETRIDGLQATLDERVSAVEGRLNAAEAAIGTFDSRLDALESLATVIRTRYRQLELSTARSAFAVGERAEIIARVTDFAGQPLDLTNVATRPWVDFVTVWGSLKAAPGFTSLAGTGGKTVTVQVNANGEARALLREATGEILAEEQELEVASVLDTTVNGIRVADAFLAASTPQATEIAPAYSIVSNAYQRSDTVVMRNYLDGIYVANPGMSYTPIAPVFTLNWRDQYATVLAFVKPDDSPGTADGAMAAGSIRVTFRDWVYPWLFTQFLPPVQPLVDTYTNVFTPLIALGLEPAVNSMFDTIQQRILPLGLLGQQRELAAAKFALTTLPATGQPSYFGSLINAVQGGLNVQQGLVYSMAVAPGVAENLTPGKAVADSGVRGEAAAETVAGTIRNETGNSIAQAETRILDQVKAENIQLTNNLLSDTGPVRRAETIALDAAGKIDAVNLELGRKAGLDLVGQLLAAQGTG